MKLTVTLGKVKDKFVVLKDPCVDVDEHVAFIRELTRNKGKISAGKSSVQVSDAIVVHSVRGTIKSRQFKA